MVSNSKTTELKTECTKQSLLDGAVIAYPTEGVWGLGCAPESTSAVQRLLEIKQRPKEPGLILVAAEIEQFEPYLSGITPDQRKKLEARWPGPVTFVVPDTGFCPEIIKGHHTTVALRVSAHPIVRALCRLKQGPLVSTSANRRGEPPAMSQERFSQCLVICWILSSLGHWAEPLGRVKLWILFRAECCDQGKAGEPTCRFRPPYRAQPVTRNPPRFCSAIWLFHRLSKDRCLTRTVG